MSLRVQITYAAEQMLTEGTIVSRRMEIDSKQLFLHNINSFSLDDSLVEFCIELQLKPSPDDKIKCDNEI